MNAPRSKIAICLSVLVFSIGAVALMFLQNPYRRLEHMGKSALRLSSGGPVRISDHIIGILHRRDPRFYFIEEADKEQKVLLASGHLVESKIAISGTRSRQEVYQALAKTYQQTGAYWAATVDLTNRVVLLISKPKDAASFAAALENE